MWQPTIQGSYQTWTATGLECRESGADCANCPVNKLLGLHKDHRDKERRCFQPQANDILLEKGIRPQLKLTPADVNRRMESNAPLTRLTQDEAQALRVEIVRLIPLMDTPTIGNIAERLTEDQFLNRPWTFTKIENFFMQLKEVGAIGSIEYFYSSRGRQRLWQVWDAAQVDMVAPKPKAAKRKTAELVEV